MITKEELKDKIVQLFESSEVLGAFDTFLISNFIANNNLCPLDIQKVLDELCDEHYKLSDGRTFQHGPERSISLPADYAMRIYAHKYLHVSILNCVRHSEVVEE